MATISKEIKDGFVIPLAKKFFGAGFNVTQPLTFEDHLEILQNQLDKLIDPLYDSVILEDPEIKAKQVELNTLIETKLQITKTNAK